MKNKSFIKFGAVALSVILSTVLISCGKKASSGAFVNAEIKALNVEVTPVSLGSVTDYHKFGGTVTAHSSVAALPDTTGKVVEIYVTEGDKVEKDQVIGKVDASRAGQNFQLSPVKSPISGTVSNVSARVGSQISPASPFAVVETLDDLEISFSVIERYSTKVAEGNKATIVFDAVEDETFDGYISHINPTLDVNTKMMAAKAKLSKEDSRIKAGMYARLNVVTQVKNDVVVVPYGALTVSADESYCYIAEGNKAKKVIVTTGIKDGNRVEITSGLKIGDKLITKGQGFISDGENIKVLN